MPAALFLLFRTAQSASGRLVSKEEKERRGLSIFTLPRQAVLDPFKLLLGKLYPPRRQ